MAEPFSVGSEFVIRALDAEQDIPRWLRLMNAAEGHKAEAERTTAEQLRKQLSWPRASYWAAEAPGDPDALVGYGVRFAQIKERSGLHILVHPEWRRRGAGSRLLARLVEEARKSGAECVYLEIDEKDTDALAFLYHHGFEAVGDVWLLRAPAEADFAAPVWPAGYTVRSYAEVRDLATLVRACNRGFGDMWGHHENTAGGVTAEELSGWLEKWDPNGLFLAFAPNGEVAGFCRAESAAWTGDAEDLVDEPGIAPEHRPLALQRPMVLIAAGWLRQQGRRPLRLESWGDTPETVALYQQLGFALVEHDLSLRRGVEPVS